MNPGALSTLGYQGLVSDFQFADRYDAVGENDRMDVDRLDYDDLEWLEEEEESKRKARAENLLTEVHSGLSALGTTIKIITALLTVLGADSTRRYIELLCGVIFLMTDNMMYPSARSIYVECWYGDLAMNREMSFSHPQQGRIDFNTVNPSLPTGMDFLIHPCR